MHLDDKIFVFGSNLAGIHGAGAALYARQYKGAIIGKGEGLHGQSYAIPTKDAHLNTLSISRVRQHVENFVKFAIEHPQLQFQVTRVGCGYAGFTDAIMEPMFNTPSNCLLPGVWLRRTDTRLYRVIIAGSRTIQSPKDVDRARRKIDRLLCNVLAEKQNRLQIVCGMAKDGGDKICLDWANANGVSVELFPANWKRFGKRAGMLRNGDMAWYGTHLIALWDKHSRGTQNMIAVAKSNKLDVRVVEFEL